MGHPYYHEHSTNCSRFWECRPDGSVCLTECASCPDESGLCEGKGSFSFDVSYQYYEGGPFCDWPSNVDCSTSVCNEMDPRPECCQDTDCQNDDFYPDAYCSTSFNCVYPQGEETSKPYTVSRFPNFCFPYDGSEIPDCPYVDPITKWPAYVEHSHNCSRYWECGPEGVIALYECARCQREIGEI